ncbi:MAG: hypothetical protein HY394_06250 [Candidatus Diapherotrites archaeon]|nr:hypothetical protein [Candidatus Diapherotrites archaeon]
MIDDAMLCRISLVVALAGIAFLFALDFLDSQNYSTITQAEGIAGAKAWVKAKAAWTKEQGNSTFFGLEDSEGGRITATIFRPSAEEKELLKGKGVVLVKGVAKKSGNGFIFIAEEIKAWKP